MNTPRLIRATRIALFFYRILWLIMKPLLQFHPRMKIGYNQRTLKTPLPKCDIWLHAASVGEAYLVEEILRHLEPQQEAAVLVTTNTSQGFDILKKLQASSPRINLETCYCPFDQPKLMTKALKSATPKLVVLIESELWPGLLSGCTQAKIPVLVINGRMTEKSMNGYLRMVSIWRNIGPRQILAMSAENSLHFAAIFGEERVSTMNNIKFDRLLRTAVTEDDRPVLTDIIPEQATFIVLGSIREEEEEVVGFMIDDLLKQQPDCIIGLFPRHMERVATWQQHLGQTQHAHQLRSQLDSPATPGSIIIWDTIGELGQGYQRANAVFVGGSLAPLGGQNFLEPLSAGVRPVIGPSWSNFAWVGDAIFEDNMVLKVTDWQETARVLLQQLESRADKGAVKAHFREYAKARQGGSEAASQAIMDYLN